MECASPAGCLRFAVQNLGHGVVGKKINLTCLRLPGCPTLCVPSAQRVGPSSLRGTEPQARRYPTLPPFALNCCFLVKKHHRTSSIPPNSRRIGLARALSKLGFCSRSQAVQLIREGKVRLNGSLAKNPEAPVRAGKDRIEVEGKQLTATEKVYLLLNKPRGIVTTAADEKGRATVYSLLPSDLPWIAPVGRLDQASEGLLLFSNDSEWAARITNPASHLDKTYHVQIARMANEQLLETLHQGVKVENGEKLQAKTAKLLRAGEKNSWLEIVLDEGKNRQIRRMLQACEIEVLRLIRVAIGPLQLGDLPKGAHRPLSPEEKCALDAALRWHRHSCLC
jgi:23S rRNA pseudouridine2605 synthase